MGFQSRPKIEHMDQRNNSIKEGERMGFQSKSKIEHILPAGNPTRS